MAFYARKLRYCTNDKVGVSVALIEITKKRGMAPIKFVLYRSIGRGGIFESIDFAGNKRETAIKAFPFGPITFDDRARELLRAGISRPRCINLWEKTTDWLAGIAAGGAYNQYPKGAWVKVGKPNTWRHRYARKKKMFRLKFGSLEHKLLFIREGKKYLRNRIYEKKGNLDTLHELYLKEKKELVRLKILFEKAELADEIMALEVEVDEIKARECLIVAEMKYVRDKKFAPAT